MLNRRSFVGRAALLTALGLSACSSYPVVDRDDGDRTPPPGQLDLETGAVCDAIDPGRCLLPWPSNTFTEADPSTATGLRLRVDAASINPRDDGSSLSAADGFSRVSPVATLFDAALDPATLQDAVHLVLAQHDHPERGRKVPLRVDTVTTPRTGLTLITADPREVLEANTDYVVVVTDALRYADQTTPAAPESVRVALGLVPPSTAEESALAGYHAPARRLLEELAIEKERVLRVWDFTTRSEENPRRALVHVREASLAAADDAGVVFDRIEASGDPNIAMVLVGRLTGLPTFLNEDNLLVLDDDGLPTRQGTTEAPFRVLVPAGTDDYRFVMYGHGMGGDELDSSFDGDLAAMGVAKVNVRFYGWNGNDVIATFTNLRRAFEGSAAAAAFLVEAIGHAAAIQRAMYGVLGDALSANTIAGQANSAAGRRPIDPTIWVGGSLGGTMGLVYAAADPEMRHAILNVPGAAWGQWVSESAVFDLLRGVLNNSFRDEIDIGLALAIAQTNLDMADGASWADVLVDKPTAFLIQESIGDPIVPNAATEMVAIAAGAQHVGGVLEPIVGVPMAAEVVDGSAITQFRTSEEGLYEVHGFTVRNTPAGAAAREQLMSFLESAWAGESIIAPPSTCPASGCDFAN